ncbi:hypothetical protein C3495_05460 [Clostridiaceae bacterium 14S0207]|nr:hypothetical protein C3495_05460 [Clostridiaceae bacterium 14S0207]
MQILKIMIETFPLIAATSYSIQNNFRSFKSEYIISQLIMQCLEELKIEGIAYQSKKCEGYELLNINLAIPMINKTDNQQNLYGKICNEIRLTDPVNFSEFEKRARKDVCILMNLLILIIILQKIVTV